MPLWCSRPIRPSQAVLAVRSRRRFRQLMLLLLLPFVLLAVLSLWHIGFSPRR